VKSLTLIPFFDFRVFSLLMRRLFFGFHIRCFFFFFFFSFTCLCLQNNCPNARIANKACFVVFKTDFQNSNQTCSCLAFWIVTLFSYFTSLPINLRNFPKPNNFSWCTKFECSIIRNLSNVIC
jgi:hypothetical protein